MQLYTIINDKTKWSNELSGNVFSVENYTKEQADEFLKSVDGYILKEIYSWETEYDDYDDKSRGGDTYYHKINVDELLICDNKVVGVILVTKHHEGGMSTCYYHNFFAVYFATPNAEKGESWNNFCKPWNSVVTPSKTQSEDSVVYIIKEEEKPLKAEFTSFALSNVLY